MRTRIRISVNKRRGEVVVVGLLWVSLDPARLVPCALCLVPEAPQGQRQGCAQRCPLPIDCFLLASFPCNQRKQDKKDGDDDSTHQPDLMQQ